MSNDEQTVRRFCQSAANNQTVIAGRLAHWLPRPADVFEIGSGSGQHAIHFAGELPHLAWQASEMPVNLTDLALNLADHAPGVPAPIELDIQGEWPYGAYDATFSANVMHIIGEDLVAPYFDGMARLLRAGGYCLLYGPYKYGGEFTTPSNAGFDQWLKSRDPASGIKDIETIEAQAGCHGIRLIADEPMPANNRLLVMERE